MGFGVCLDEHETKTPKARIVILVYLDPVFENKPAASPTMTRNTRQLLQFGAWIGFSAAKGDVSGAFLQGRNLQRDLWVPPVLELAAALNVSLGEIMKLKKAAYGLVEAPVEWYISLSTVLTEHGWRRLKYDPCFTYKKRRNTQSDDKIRMSRVRSNWRTC